MLCLVLAACWSLAIAEDIVYTPNNNIATKEENSFISTISNDPWSPIVGDTKGAPAVTEEATLADGFQGRRAAISLVETIRKSLMRDNYDYVSDNSKEFSPQTMKKTSSLIKSTTPTSALKTSLQTARTTSAVPLTTIVVTPYHTIRLPSPWHTTPMLSPIQVASVSMAFKSKSGKQFRSFNNSPLLTSSDKEPHRPATTMSKDVKSEIVVSKKDLLFYLDDMHLRRNNAHSPISSIAGRRKFDSADTKKVITKKIRKQGRYGKQKLHSRNSENDNHNNKKHTNKNDDLNKNDPQNHQSQIKTLTHTDDQFESVKYERNKEIANEPENQDNVDDDKDVQQREEDDEEGLKLKEEFDNGNNKSENNKQNHDIKEDDNKNVQPISELKHGDAKKLKKLAINMQINDSQSGLHRHDHKKIEKEQFGVNKKVQQNNQASRKQKQHQKQNNLRINGRKNNYRCTHKSKTTHIKRLDNTEESNSFDDKDNQLSIKREVRSQVNKSSRNINQHIKHNKTGYKSKHVRHKNHRLKKLQLRHDHSEQSSEQLHNLQNSEEDNSKHLHKSIKNRIRHQPRESVDDKSDQPKKQSNGGNSLYRQSMEDDKSEDKIILKGSSLLSTKPDHRHYTLKKNEINDDVADSKLSSTDKTNDMYHNNDLSNTLHGDTQDDELKSEHNNEENEQNKSQKSQYIDSIDNEDFDKFNGRRMNTLTNDTQPVREFDKRVSQCNNSHQGCVSVEDKKHDKQNVTQGEQELSSPTAKYKLLKVRSARGLRRSNTGERQFLQERGPKGVALIALDGEPFPQFRLPRSRRQYMDDLNDKRPPLIEQISRRSLNRIRRRGRKYKN